ncbi:MAG: hypothetical protein ACI8TQ_004034, partial [Planctomycetota bacterium]
DQAVLIGVSVYWSAKRSIPGAIVTSYSKVIRM